MNIEELWAQAQGTNSFGAVEDYKKYLSDWGGEGGGASFNQQVYDDNYRYTLPGQEGEWAWNANSGERGKFEQSDQSQWINDVQNVNKVIEDNGSGGLAFGEDTHDTSPGWLKGAVEEYMPMVTMALITAMGGAAIGGVMGAGGAAAGEGVAAGAAAEGAAAPTFTYGVENPAWMNWSQAGGTELGTGFYGTDAGSMAGMFGTTANSGAGLGSGIGSGLAAEGGIWAGAGGGWEGLMAEAAANGSSLTAKDAYDLYKKANNAYKLYNAVAGAPAGAPDATQGGLNGGVGMVGSGGLSQSLGGQAGVKTSVPGMAAHTDMTSEIGQIPMMGIPPLEMPQSNNALPKPQDNAMLGGLGFGKFPYL